MPRPEGSIPAWAGETGEDGHHDRRLGVDPRVGGGDAGGDCAGLGDGGRSPRGRGRPTPPEYSPAGARSIPAWAGETRTGGAQ